MLGRERIARLPDLVSMVEVRDGLLQCHGNQ
jgi:hypothetical protein